MPKALEEFIGQPVGDCKKLAWFGLSADPPTKAHRKAVDAVLGSGLVEKVVVFAAGNLPYKKFGADDRQRASMMEIWYEQGGSEERVLISRFDLLREKAITWIELWQTLQRIAPKIQHYLVVGSDQYLDIAETWNQGEVLLDEAQFIVVPRVDKTVTRVLDHHHLLDVDPIEGSSTEVREGVKDLVDDKMEAFIQAENLYQSS